jgi:hypothetical protein
VFVTPTVLVIVVTEVVFGYEVSSAVVGFEYVSIEFPVDARVLKFQFILAPAVVWSIAVLEVAMA